MSPTLRPPGPRPGVERIRRRYGAHPAHLLVLAGALAIALIAGRPLLDEGGLEVVIWFAGSAILHDAVFVMAYIGADSLLVRAWRRRPGRVAWINFVRVPAAISAIMFVVYSPVILGKATSFQSKTLRSTDAYLGHWLLVSAVLAGISLTAYLARVLVVAWRRRQ
ncbi:MAG: hypothetical protein ACT4PP_10140 [Sporichthyaceae bacterium]